MPLTSLILSGSGRLDSAAAGGPSVRKAPPADDLDAVQRIQRALRELGFPLNNSFSGGQPDGRFGNETENAVIGFQQKAFPGQYDQFDGRVGKNTLAKMDERLPQDSPAEPGSLPPLSVASTSKCLVAEQTTTSPQNQVALNMIRNLQHVRPTFIG